MDHFLRCVNCGAEYEPGLDRLLCDRCPSTVVDGMLLHHGILAPVYDLDRVRRLLGPKPFGEPGTGMHRFGMLLPAFDGAAVTLGEGDTPLLDCRHLAGRLDLEHLYVKQEAANPNGAFKDREACVVVNVALALGAEAISCATSGSMGASLTAYGARAGIPAWIMVPGDTALEKMMGALIAGGRVVAVDGIYETAVWLEAQGSREFGWYSCTCALNPYRTDGDKTITYEIWEQLGGREPDCVLIPTGGGGDLCGQWKAWGELLDLGLTERLPRMISVGATAGAPLVTALREGLDDPPVKRIGPTIAGGLASSCLDYGRYAMRAVRDSDGIATAVTDDELLGAQRLLAETEGVFVEPSAAAGIAALPHLIEEGRVDAADTIVVVVTGSGFHDAGTLVGRIPEPPHVADSMEALRRRVAEMRRE